MFLKLRCEGVRVKIPDQETLEKIERELEYNQRFAEEASLSLEEGGAFLCFDALIETEIEITNIRELDNLPQPANEKVLGEIRFSLTRLIMRNLGQKYVPRFISFLMSKKKEGDFTFEKVSLYIPESRLPYKDD